MKTKLPLLILIMGLSPSLFGQFTQVLQTNWASHYLHRDADGLYSDSLSAHVIRVMADNGQSWDLNTIIDYERQRIDAPQFLLRTIDHLADRIWFHDPGSFVLLTQTEVGQQWLFDTTAQVMALHERTSIETIYEQQDSVRLILLSTGDSIRWSQNYGLLQFPDG
ncbi:MAG: hypothetical protein AAF206_27970, partial [Bacteroidota bacterium]